MLQSAGEADGCASALQVLPSSIVQLSMSVRTSVRMLLWNFIERKGTE